MAYKMESLWCLAFALLAVSSEAACLQVAKIEIKNLYSTKLLAVTELQAFANGTNVALSASATATSTDGQNSASKAIDGNYDQSSNFYLASSTGSDQILTILLAQPEDVTSIKLFGRSSSVTANYLWITMYDHQNSQLFSGSGNVMIAPYQRTHTNMNCVVINYDYSVLSNLNDDTCGLLELRVDVTADTPSNTPDPDATPNTPDPTSTIDPTSTPEDTPEGDASPGPTASPDDSPDDTPSPFPTVSPDDTPDATPPTTTYQWYRTYLSNGATKTAIVNATSNVYYPTSADMEGYVFVEVTEPGKEPKLIKGRSIGDTFCSNTTHTSGGVFSQRLEASARKLETRSRGRALA